MSTPTRKDWILWGALGCALVATYHAEYTLAVAAGFHPYVALAVPGALDLYVIRALQQRRDVLVAVLAMVAANVASHLIAKDVLQVGWQVIAAVGAIAPLVLWRVYSLKHTRNRQELIHGVQAGALEYTGEVSAPVAEWAPVHDKGSGELLGFSTPDRIPDWMDREYPVSTAPPVPGVQMTPEEYTEYERMWPSAAAEVDTSTPPLPALPPEYAPGTAEYPCTCEHPSTTHNEHGCYSLLCPCRWRRSTLPSAPVLTEDAWDELTATDREYLGELNEYVHSTESHTLAGLRAALGIGQARATRLIKHARKEGVW